MQEYKKIQAISQGDLMLRAVAGKIKRLHSVVAKTSVIDTRNSRKCLSGQLVNIKSLRGMFKQLVSPQRGGN